MTLRSPEPANRCVLPQSAKAVATECSATEGQRLLHLGTVDVANDVEVIRRALGEPQVSFVGLSYGTLIGQLWAQAYPASVRALVLDGVVNPASGGASSSVDQAEGIDAAFLAIDSGCAADAHCPLQASGGLTGSYDELARRLDAAPPGRPPVGPNQLAYAAFYATYDPATWPRLWQAVAAGLTGDLSGIGDVAADYERLVPYTTFALVTCLDGPHPTGYAAWEGQAAAMVRSSPRFGRVLANELLPCAFWPETGYTPQPVTASGAPPILVIGSTGDAATPYAQAVDVAHTLRSGVLLTVHLDGHVALGDSDCATQIATRYLIDLTVPAPTTSC